MSGSTPVCQKGSVRKCVCRACKPHATRGSLIETLVIRKKTECKCKLTEAAAVRQPSLETIDESNTKLAASNLIKQCDCIGCRPVFTSTRKRFCECENAKPHRISNKTSLFMFHGKPSKKSSSREKTVETLNEKLSETLLSADRNKSSNNSNEGNDFVIIAKKSSSFLLEKIDSGTNIKTNDSNSILVKSESNHDIRKIDENKTNPLTLSRNRNLTFSQEKLVVEFDRKQKSLCLFDGISFVLYCKGDSTLGNSEVDEEEEEGEGDSISDLSYYSDDEENSLSPEDITINGKDIDKFSESEWVSGKSEGQEGRRRADNIKGETMEDEQFFESEKTSELRVKLPSKTAKETDPESELKVIKISDKSHIHEDNEPGEKKDKYEKHDPNKMYYSKYITEYDSKRIIYGLHRLLHNYVMFRCADREITEGIISEAFIEKLSEGCDMFLKNAYFYDPYYQPISFKRRYGYIELHLKVGVDDMFANRHRIFKKVFLVIFHRGSVKFILTKYKKPGKMIERSYNYGVNSKKCQDVWCRLDFITAIVNRRHRRVKHRLIETLYDILIADEKGFFKMVEPLEDLWVCIDFDTESENWSKTERTQFIKMMRKESDPYFKENLKYVDPLETQLEQDRKKRKRKYKE